ncbi:MAG: cation:dicarboxylase symporter family transporter [Planctomycetota bacterium]|nr:cation:dicarboxylase symporter family transporter [Planctomycetota bacterium]
MLKFWKWEIHWQVALAIGVGVVSGFLLQLLDAEPGLGVALSREDGEPPGVVSTAGDFRRGDVVLAVAGRRVPPGELPASVLSGKSIGKEVEVLVGRDGREVSVWTTVTVGENSPRAALLAPFDVVAALFRLFLQMLIVPLIFTSLVVGVTNIETVGGLGRLGVKTLLFYVGTSLLAILCGLVLVNVFQPGWNSALELRETVDPSQLQGDASLTGMLLRVVPGNVFASLSENGAILQVIFFSLLLGVFIRRVGGEHGALLSRFFRAAFEVMMGIARFVLAFIPLMVFALLARAVGSSGFEQFVPLLKFMLVVVVGLVFHASVTLPLFLALVGRIRPLAWARAVLPALLTAFSTSSSSLTLPETLRSVQERGKVTPRTSAFVLPLGATINMDGTALYLCVSAVFLAQHYESSGGYELTLGDQGVVVVMALLLSIGAAGIPSAAVVMMTTILVALGLPVEGVTLLMTIDRPLDMLRTSVNVWSDTACAAVVGVSEGERDITGHRPL